MENKPTSSARLSVSIVLYYSPVELLRSTIGSLYVAAQNALSEGRLVEIVLLLIDNSQNRVYGNTVRDAMGTVKYDEFFTLKYIEAPDNNGFGAGHNLLLAEPDSEYHLILNPDVELARSALSTGLAALQNDVGIALVSPRATGSAGAQEFLCKSYPSVWVLLLRAFAPAFVCDYFRPQLDHYEMREVCTGDQPEEVLLASGCFMLLRSEAFAGVGGFSDRYFLYFEDFDLSLRLRDKGKLIFLPAMQITHLGGYAASKGFRHIWLFIKSGARFFSDHGWKWI